MISSAEELVQKLKPLMHKWHECVRSNNDGNAGNTLEDLLGVAENNFSLPDFGDVELKTQEYETGSLLTLFHSEPLPSASVPKLLKSIGWKHSEAGGRYKSDEMSFRSTTYAHRYSVRGLRVVRDANSKRINFVFEPKHVKREEKDATGVYSVYGDWVDDVLQRQHPNYQDVFPVYYEMSTVEAKFKQKLDHTLLVMFKKKNVGGKKYFSYEEGYLVRNLQLNKLWQYFDAGLVVVDFDARTRHNHGTKFRIQKNMLTEIFDTVKIIT